MAGAGDGEGLLALGDVGDAGQVGADGEHERLAGDADGLDLAGLGPGAQPVDRGLQPCDGLRPEGVGPGVVVPVVEGDQGEDAGAAGQGDVLHRGAGHDLLGQPGADSAVGVVVVMAQDSLP